MKTLSTAALAAALMATAATPLMAQTYGPPQTSAQAQYQRNQSDYDRAYEDYQRQRSQYESDRAEYDRRYGSGAYDRYYANRRPNTPVYDPRPGQGGPDRYDPYDPYRNSPCEQRRTSSSSDRTAGTIIGALVGGAIGVGVANDRDEGKGAVLGALVGGALGNQIAANSSDRDRYTAKCDSVGYYWTYDQTTPYQEDSRYRNTRSGRYDSRQYTRQRCRLAVAPAEYGGRTDYRYVRVCPDRNNRYRITS